MSSFLRKCAATRLARIGFQWPITDPGSHLAPQGDLELIVMDYNIISLVLQGGKISTPSVTKTVATRTK